jgi:hypothetical protein
MTIGMVAVAVLSALAAGVPPVTMTSTLRSASSAASPGSRSALSSPHLHSSAIVRPLGIAELLQPFDQGFGAKRKRRRRPGQQDADPRQLAGLLRVRGAWPCD